MKYQKEMKNIQTQINNKCELFKSIFDDQKNIELRKMLLEDYSKFFIIKYLEKRKINYKMNEKLLSLLYILMKVKLCDSGEKICDFNNFKYQYSLKEFIEIILFTQGYKEDIKNIFEIYLHIIKYDENFDKNIETIISKNEMKYEISKRNEKYTNTNK